MIPLKMISRPTCGLAFLFTFVIQHAALSVPPPHRMLASMFILLKSVKGNPVFGV